MRIRSTEAYTPSGIPPQSPVHCKMVGWYDPSQLARTAVEVFLSTIFGRHTDHRLQEALATPNANIFDYSEYADGQTFWLDYVADVGDGWDSTYAIAYHLAQPTLRVADHETQRGSILVFGGDEVYPTATRKEYQQRLIAPYETALRDSPPESCPHAFAVPGNHDWYDSLVSFTRLFLAKQWLGGRRCPQTRSYFALKLPRGWWLLGTDVQLGSDIDQPQVEYFRQVKQHMNPEDRVILCNAEPHWIYAAAYGQDDTDYSENNLAFLESDKVLGRRVSVYVAGDLHHYRRHATADGRQKITAGGGGAFLHPTHGDTVDHLSGGYEFKHAFPDKDTSRKLTWRNLMFPALNPKFGVFTAILYVLTAWSVKAPIGGLGLGQFDEALYRTLHTTVNDPQAVLWSSAVFAGFLFFTDTHKRLYRIIAGPVHGLVHVVAIFFLGWATSYFCVSFLGWPFESIRQLLLSGLLIAAGGWIIGSWIMGLYLLISLNFFGRHQNEAFSSLAIPDWKHFLRFRIDERGMLTIFPIGLKRVPRRWKPRSGHDGPELVPDDINSTPPQLIESPIQVDLLAQP